METNWDDINDLATMTIDDASTTQHRGRLPPLKTLRPFTDRFPICFASTMYPVIGRSDSERSDRSAPRRLVKKRVSADVERLSKARKTVDHSLRRQGAHFGKELSLNAEGVAYLPFKKFIVVIEVPEDNPSVCFLYAMVCRVQAKDKLAAVLRKAMQLNYMQYGTRGATLGLEGEEVNLCFSAPVATLAHSPDLRAVLEDFLQTCVEMHEHLELAKR